MSELSLTYDCVLLIMNCNKYSIKAETQKNTWLRDMNYLPFFHVIGDPDLHYEYEFRYETNKLIICVDDDYKSLPKKVIRAYEAIRKHFPSIKYILKTDDDQILQPTNANKFFETIRKMLFKSIEQNEKIHYAGNIVNVNQPYLSKYHEIHSELPEHLPIQKTKYCNGRFYIVSDEAVDDLLKKRHYIDLEFLEDYAIGYHLSDEFKKTIKHLASEMYFKDMQT